MFHYLSKINGPSNLLKIYFLISTYSLYLNSAYHLFTYNKNTIPLKNHFVKKKIYSTELGFRHTTRGKIDTVFLFLSYGLMSNKYSDNSIHTTYISSVVSLLVLSLEKIILHPLRISCKSFLVLPSIHLRRFQNQL